MGTVELPRDFKDFLKLLNSRAVEYLIVGGYAVNYYGYLRPTADIDIWVGASTQNALKVVDVIREFGFDVPELSPNLLASEGKMLRMEKSRSESKY